MRWIILLRGVNVGGHGRAPMAALRLALAAAGAANVATYIQSGNIVLDHPAKDPAQLAAWTTAVVAQAFGHRPAALAFTPAELAAIRDANPFPRADAPKRLHFHLFCDAPAADALARLTPALTGAEAVAFGPHCLYHWTPQGFGTSRVAPRIPAALGVTTTARNLTSLRAILDLA